MSTLRRKLIARYTRHAEAMDRLFITLRQVEAAILHRNPPGGGWSALQTLHHVLAAERAGLTSAQKKLASGKRYARAGLRERWHSLLLDAALYLPLKFKSPEAVRGEHLPPDTPFDELQRQWQTLRADWLTFFNTLPDDWLRSAVYRHPRAGTLAWRDMIAFYNHHRKRHTLQIRRAIKGI